MDIRDLINLRKEECFFKRAEMTGFMKGQKTKWQHRWHRSPLISQPTICEQLAKGTLIRNKTHFTVMSLRAQGGYLIQSHCQKNWLFFFSGLCVSKNGILLKSSLWSEKLIPMNLLSVFYTINWIWQLEKNLLLGYLISLTCHHYSYLRSLY